MLKILYLASLRERLGRGSEDLELPAGVSDVADLIDFLAARKGPWENLATVKNLRHAVNHEMARRNAPLAADDEVAFFPPVTGG